MHTVPDWCILFLFYINDFKGEGAFNSIHEMCKDLHFGKTWTDVEIAVEISKR